MHSRWLVAWLSLAVAALIVGCARRGVPVSQRPVGGEPSGPDESMTQMRGPASRGGQPPSDLQEIPLGREYMHRERLREVDLKSEGPYVRRHYICLSDDGAHLAYIRWTGKAETVVWDTRMGPAYFRITAVAMSPDGQHVAYSATTEAGRSVVVWDGVEGEEYGWVELNSPTFSPDSQHLAYVASDGPPPTVDAHWRQFKKPCFVVHDRERGPGFRDVLAVRFSPDGRRLAYSACRDNRRALRKWSVVVDGHTGPAWNSIRDLTFSPDGKRVAYVGTVASGWSEESGFKDEKKTMVIDGQRSAGYDVMWRPTFSPDSRFVWYDAMRRSGDEVQWETVLVGPDGTTRLGTSASPGVALPTFSPDGRRTAWVSWRGEGDLRRARVVVDGEEQGEYRGVHSLAFSPNSKRLAYVGAPVRAPGGKSCMVIDGEQGPPYDHVGRPVFNADGSRVAYCAVGGGKWFVVLDGEKGAEYDLHDGERGPVRPALAPSFSPDGRRLAYRARKGEKWVVVVDGVEGNEYDGIKASSDDDPIVFSGDGQHVAYCAQKGEKWVAVLDGEEGREYDEIRRGPPRFDAHGTLHYLAYRGGVLHLVKQPPPKDIQR